MRGPPAPPTVALTTEASERLWGHMSLGRLGRRSRNLSEGGRRGQGRTWGSGQPCFSPCLLVCCLQRGWSTALCSGSALGACRGLCTDLRCGCPARAQVH